MVARVVLPFSVLIALGVVCAVDDAIRAWRRYRARGRVIRIETTGTYRRAR